MGHFSSDIHTSEMRKEIVNDAPNENSSHTSPAHTICIDHQNHGMHVTSPSPSHPLTRCGTGCRFEDRFGEIWVTRERRLIDRLMHHKQEKKQTNERTNDRSEAKQRGKERNKICFEAGGRSVQLLGPGIPLLRCACMAIGAHP